MKLKIRKNKYVRYSVGVDEVGRGPLAGPVTVAAFLMPISGKLGNKNLPKLRDSKKLSEKHRNEWSRYLRGKTDCGYAIASFSAKKIDRLNISRSANLCAEKVLLKLEEKTKIKNLHKKANIYLDGGLYIGKKNSGIGKTVIKGDEKIKVISAASILAKVHRDRLMDRYATIFTSYNFHKNKGYGTKEHIAAIKIFGPTEIHRKTYIGNLI